MRLRMEREKPLIMRRSMAKRKPLNITMKRAPSITIMTDRPKR